MGEWPEGMKDPMREPARGVEREHWNRGDEIVQNYAGDATSAARGLGDEAAGRAAGDDRSPEQIRAEIEATRADLSETVDAIQDRLRPSNMVSRATDSVKQAATDRARGVARAASETAEAAMDQTRETAYEAMETVRDNPLPTTLIGIGAALAGVGAYLAMNNRAPRNRAIDRGYTAGYSRYDEEWLDTPESDSRRSDVRGVSAGAPRYASMSRGDTTGANRSTMDEVGRRVSSATGRARDVASDASHAVRRATERGRSGLERSLHERPMAMAAVALGIGALIGASLPATERENQVLGSTRDDLVDRAQDMARDAKEKVKHAATDLTGTVQKVQKVMGED